MSSLGTRSKTDCPIIGAPSELPSNVLPTIEDILKCYLLIRNDLKFQQCGKDPSVLRICQILCDKVFNIWKTSSIPTVSTNRIIKLIQDFHSKYLGLIRYPKQKRNENYDHKVKTFKDKIKTLFDIATCKCQSFVSCTCEKQRKIPKQEQVFLQDQRTSRKMILGPVDIKETIKAQKKEERRNREISKTMICKTVFGSNISVPEIIKIGDSYTSESASDVDQSATSFEEIQAELQPESSATNSQMRLPLPTVARICDQFGLSDRTAAAVTSAVLQDVGLITDNNTNLVIDRSKVRRARQKNRSDMKTKFIASSTEVKGLFFDGRKDKTLSQEKIGNVFHRRVIKEEHISVLQEPGSKYLGHVTPTSGSGRSIANAIVNLLNESGIGSDSLLGIGCDGTVVNTGKKNGAIRFLELELKRPLQWLICQLHLNELPLRHLFQHLDGATSGPKEYSGPIGKLLECCEQMPVVNYVAIDGDLPKIEAEANNLSTDQIYLYQICNAIISGGCSLELASRNPGKMSHARWLTTANRLLRLYIASESPSDNLVTIATFIIRVYAPVWFSIKRYSSCIHGVKHIFKMIQLSRYLDDNLKAIIDPVIKRNAFFCHPENILLAMITDDRHSIKELGLRRILRARKNSSLEVREFIIPDIDLNASDYFELIDWQKNVITSPPLLRSLTDDNIRKMIGDKTFSALDDMEFHLFPCHTQPVERCVKLVTEASNSVVGHEARDGFIRAKIYSREILPRFETKADYNTSKQN